MPDPARAGPKALIVRRRILLVGVNPYVRLAARTVARIAPGRRGPIPVRVRVNGLPAEPHRVNLMPATSEGFRLYLNGQVRAASGAAVGDAVRLWVAYDAEYRAGPTHPFPRGLRQGLRRSPIAARTWASLAPSRRKEVLRYLAHLRSDGARRSNVDRALRVLGGSPERFLGRVWVEDVRRGDPGAPTGRRPRRTRGDPPEPPAQYS